MSDAKGGAALMCMEARSRSVKNVADAKLEPGTVGSRLTSLSTDVFQGPLYT